MDRERLLLFFYGTLMSGGERGHVLRDRPVVWGGQPDRIDLAEPIAAGTIRGDLYNVAGGAFPALLRGDGIVHGEVWEARSLAHFKAVLSVTDRIEGFQADKPERSMYLRVPVPLLSADGGDLEPGTIVSTYLWNGSVPGDQIEDGQWARAQRGAFA